MGRGRHFMGRSPDLTEGPVCERTSLVQWRMNSPDWGVVLWFGWTMLAGRTEIKHLVFWLLPVLSVKCRYSGMPITSGSCAGSSKQTQVYDRPFIQLYSRAQFRRESFGEYEV